MNCYDCISRWRRWIRPLVIFIYVVLLFVGLPLMIIEFTLKQTQHHIQAWFIAGFFVLMTVPISLWGILQHIVHNTQPILQRHIVRILWMVPIYAGDAWFALRFKKAAIYLDTMRECYEAYVIYNFMAYLMAFLRMQHPNLEYQISLKPQVKHFFPFCCLPPWSMNGQLLNFCKHGVLQYTVIRPLTTCVALITQLAGVYHEGDFSFKSTWSYIAVINNISQVWAMYCLVLFYMATKEELQPMKPVGKFLCVKAVVFLSFWQQVLIAALVKAGVIKDSGIYDSAKDVATGLQDFCICIEMFLAAIAHYFSFSHKPYIDPEAEQIDCCSSFLSMWDVSDVRDEVYDHVRTVGKTVVRPLRGRLNENERTPLLSGSSSSDENNKLISVVNYTQEDTPQRSGSPSSIGDYLDAGAYQDARSSYTASMNNYLDEEEVEDGTSDELHSHDTPVHTHSEKHEQSESNDTAVPLAKPPQNPQNTVIVDVHNALAAPSHTPSDQDNDPFPDNRQGLNHTEEQNSQNTDMQNSNLPDNVC